MAESGLSITLGTLRSEVGDQQGVGRTFATMDPDDQAKVTQDINAGLRTFYYPPPTAEGQHTWSFLRSTASQFADVSGNLTVNLTAAVSTYNLPDEFSTIMGGVTLGDGSDVRVIPVIPEVRVRALLANNDTQGIPRVCAIRAKTPATAGSPTRYEVLFHPIPDTTYTPTYTYGRIPTALLNDNDVPEGGMMHSDTILESCLAMAELRRDDEGSEGTPRIHHQLFQERLAASIAIDRQSMRIDSGGSWPAEESTTIEIGYHDFVREISGYLDKGWDIDGMTHEDFKMCDFVVQSGVRSFYQARNWDFLQVEGSITLTDAAATYQMPEDFGSVSDNFTWPEEHGGGQIARTSEQHLRSLRSGDTTGAADLTGDPKYFCLRPRESAGTETQRWEVEFYPTPDATSAASVLRFRYNKRPERISRERPHPLGNWLHSETILQSCLGVAEGRFKSDETAQREKYAQLLEYSMRLDESSTAITSPSAWPTSGTSDTLYMQYEDYAREIGGYLDFGFNDAGWTHDQDQEIDFIIQAGLRQAYFPMKTDSREAHAWNFLEATTDVYTWQQMIPSSRFADAVVVDAVAYNSPVAGQTTVTVLSSAFTSDMVNELLVVDDNTFGRVVSVTSGTVCIVDRISGFPLSDITTGAIGQQVVVSPTLLWQKVYDATADETTVEIVDVTDYDSTATSPWLFRSNMQNELITEETNDYAAPFLIKRITDTKTAVLSGNMTNLATWQAHAFYTRDPQGDYFIPPSENGMDGIMTFKSNTSRWQSIPFTTEARIRRLRSSSLVQTSIPQMVSRRATESDGATLQLFEFVFYPIPTQEWQLQYRFYIVPPKLTTAAPRPLGGVEHQALFLASMLAQAEQKKTQKRGVKWEEFLKALEASITKDRRAQPEMLGYNGDASTTGYGALDHYRDYYWNSSRTSGVTVGGI